MDEVNCNLIVFFEEPFWIGVFEKISDGGLSVCKVTFGAELKDYEVYDYILKNYYKLKFSPAVNTEVRKATGNPKRLQRNVKKQLQSKGIGTKSQQALQLQRKQMKTEQKKVNKEQKTAEKKHLFELKQQKKKGKHRGR